MFDQDKRKFVRVPCENVIAYSVLKVNGGVDMAHSGYVHAKNISLGGILFSAFELLEKDRRLQMKLRIEAKDQQDTNIGLIGEVVRAEKMPEGKKWDIAVAIIYVEQSKQDLFNTWINNKIL